MVLVNQRCTRTQRNRIGECEELHDALAKFQAASGSDIDTNDDGHEDESE